MNDPARNTLARLISHWPTIGGDTHDPAAQVRIHDWLRAIRHTQPDDWPTISDELIAHHPRAHPPGIADWQAAARSIAARRHQHARTPIRAARPDPDVWQTGLARCREALDAARRPR